MMAGSPYGQGPSRRIDRSRSLRYYSAPDAEIRGVPRGWTGGVGVGSVPQGLKAERRVGFRPSPPGRYTALQGLGRAVTFRGGEEVSWERFVLPSPA